MESPLAASMRLPEATGDRVCTVLQLNGHTATTQYNLCAADRRQEPANSDRIIHCSRQRGHSRVGRHAIHRCG